MKKKFFKRRSDIDNYPTVIVKVEETDSCIFINFTSWVTPTDYCDDLSKATNEIKKLGKLTRMGLWKSLSQQGFFYEKVYLTNLHFPPTLLPTNQQAFMNLELVVYRRDISDDRPNIETITHITNPMVDILNNNTYFKFNRNKAF